MFLESITGSIITKALDISSYNHKLIATNIANLGVSGYVPGHIKFDDVMKDLRDQVHANSDENTLHASIEHTNENLNSFVISNGKEASIDSEMINLTENTLRYEALLRARAELGKILKTAISGGGRG